MARALTGRLVEAEKIWKENSSQASFNENDPLPEFSFAGRPLSKEELEEVIHDLSDPWVRTPAWAIPALRRGIAVHHAGMPKAYRVAIEK